MTANPLSMMKGLFVLNFSLGNLIMVLDKELNAIILPLFSIIVLYLERVYPIMNF